MLHFRQRPGRVTSFDLACRAEHRPCAIISLMDKALIILSLLSFLLIITLMYSVSPSDVGVLGVFGFFILCYVLFLGLAVFGCRLFFRFRAYLNKVHANGIERKSYYYGAAVAIAPMVLLVCSSLGGITILEIILVLLAEIVLCFLIAHDIL